MACPYHVALAVAVQSHGFDVRKVGPHPVGGHQPFFATRSKSVNAATIGGVLKSIDARYSLAVEDALDPELDSIFGGHSCRRAGAQYWHRLGLQDALIRRLARWKSDCIEIYLLNAPLENLSIASFAGASSATDLSQSVTITRAMEEVNILVHQHLQQLKITLQENSRAVAAAPVQIEKPVTQTIKIVVTNIPGKPKRVHRVSVLTGPPSHWTSACGFSFGRNQNISLHEATREEVQNYGCVCARGCF